MDPTKTMGVVQKLSTRRWLFFFQITSRPEVLQLDFGPCVAGHLLVAVCWKRKLKNLERWCVLFIFFWSGKLHWFWGLSLWIWSNLGTYNWIIGHINCWSHKNPSARRTASTWQTYLLHMMNMGSLGSFSLFGHPLQCMSSFSQNTPMTTRWWFQIFFIFTPTWVGKWSNLTNIFQMGWNHQPDDHFRSFSRSIIGYRSSSVTAYTCQLMCLCNLDISLSRNLLGHPKTAAFVFFFVVAWWNMKYEIWNHFKHGNFLVHGLMANIQLWLQNKLMILQFQFNVRMTWHGPDYYSWLFIQQNKLCALNLKEIKDQYCRSTIKNQQLFKNSPAKIHQI